jgi:flagellar basal-body rod modification protein FlgD
MTSAVHSLSVPAAAASTGTATATPASKNDPNSVASENVFLQLLVAQLKHQDPTSPADPTQFVSQLAQFTTLEQSTQMRTDLDQIVTELKPPVTTPAAGTPQTS